MVENGHCARWACRLDGPEVAAGAHARPASSWPRRRAWREGAAGCGAENPFCYLTGGRARVRHPRRRRGRHRSRKPAPGANERICRYANFLDSVQTRCTTHAAALLAFVMREALGSRPAPGTPSAKRSVGTRRAASMQDTLPEGTARAAQLAPSAVTASAVGGSATRSVVADSLRRRAALRGARAIARRRGSKLGWLGMCWRVLGEWRETRAKMSAPF